MEELVLQEIDTIEKKLVGLAEAIPEDKYGWRPNEDVRSVSEVFMHVAGGYFMMPNFMGVKPPEGVDRGIEKTVTAKAEVVAKLKQSIEHIRGAVKGVPAGGLDKPIKIFGGRESTVGGLLMILVTHGHEHLGQMIAYARVNGVAPPWSR